MSADVERTIVDVVGEYGGMSQVDAQGYVQQLKDDERYVQDVY
jgi:sulfite reductase alpha subunit-like flavoprotein